MPGKVQGPELARILRGRHPDLRVVLVSGYPRDIPIVAQPDAVWPRASSRASRSPKTNSSKPLAGLIAA